MLPYDPSYKLGYFYVKVWLISKGREGLGHELGKESSQGEGTSILESFR